MRLSIVTGFFLPVPPVQGGSTEKIWHRLAAIFAARGHQVTFVSRAWPGMAARERVDGVDHIRLPGADLTGSLARNLVRDALWGIRVARALPAGDAVLCNTITLPAWLRRVRPSAGRVVAVVARMPKGHGKAYGNVDLLLALSDAVRDKLVAEKASLAPRIAPFPYPIDWDLHARAGDQARAAGQALAAPGGPGPVSIGFIGRIHPEKGLALLVGAAARLADRGGLPGWTLDLTGPWEVGQGGGGAAFRDSLTQGAAGVRLGPRLRLHGPEFSAGALAARYAASPIFCYPSLAERGETFGVAVAEAMATGAAPVVSSLPCFGALVDEGVTGFAFDHRAADAQERLAAALGRLLADPALRASVGARARAHTARFDFGPCADEVLGRLHTLTGRA